MDNHKTTPETTNSRPEQIQIASEFTIEKYAEAELPTKHGQFQLISFTNDLDHEEHVALIKGDVWNQTNVPVRLHSECVTGDVLGSLRCDCGEQLELALELLGQSEHGILLYMRQEGRGIGLAEKVKAYNLQDEGMDTIEANEHLGFDADLRDYSVAAGMLKILGPKSIELYTNNPGKVEGLRDCGIDVVERHPIRVVPNPHNLNYLKTKRDKAGHLL